VTHEFKHNPAVHDGAFTELMPGSPVTALADVLPTRRGQVR